MKRVVIATESTDVVEKLHWEKDSKIYNKERLLCRTFLFSLFSQEMLKDKSYIRLV